MTILRMGDTDYRYVNLTEAKLSTGLAFQQQTKVKGRDFVDLISVDFGRLAAGVWASLWEAGQQPSWEEIMDMREGEDFKIVYDSPAVPSSDEAAGEDPTKALPDSGQGESDAE